MGVGISVEPASLTFEVPPARGRIPSLVRYPLMMRNLKSRSIPLGLTIADVDTDSLPGEEATVSEAEVVAMTASIF